MNGPITPLTSWKPQDKKQKDIELHKVGVGMQVIMGMCWEDVPELRPTAEMIRRAIKRLDEVDGRQPVDGQSLQSLKPPWPDARIDHHRLYDVLTRVS